MSVVNNILEVDKSNPTGKKISAVPNVENPKTEEVNLTPKRNYNDVSSAQKDAVDYVSSKGYMIGISDTSFNPNGTLTRAQAVQILYAMEGKPKVNGNSSFGDVKGNAWYKDATIWAQQNGIVAGYPDGNFKPDYPITANQMSLIMKKYAQTKGIDASNFAPSGDGYAKRIDMANFLKTFDEKKSARLSMNNTPPKTPVVSINKNVGNSATGSTQNYNQPYKAPINNPTTKTTTNNTSNRTINQKINVQEKKLSKADPKPKVKVENKFQQTSDAALHSAQLNHRYPKYQPQIRHWNK